MGVESKLTAKCQTTIPAEVRDYLKIGPGDRIRYVLVDGKIHIVPRNRPVEGLFGRLQKYAIPETSLQDYDAAVADAVISAVEPSADKRQ